MKKWKYLFIAAVLLGSAWVLIPSVRFYSMSSEARAELSADERAGFLESAIKLGLDLQGGMHLVVEIDESQLSADEKKDAMDRVIRIFRNRVDQFGVAEPVIQRQGDRRIIIQLPGLTDPERAKSLIGTTAQLNFHLVRDNDELRRVLQDLDRVLKGVEVIGSRVDSTAAEMLAEDADLPDSLQMAEDTPFDTTESATTPFDTLIPTLPGADEVELPLRTISEDAPFTSYLVPAAGGEIYVDERQRQAVDLLLATPQAQGVIPRQSAFFWGDKAKPIEGGGVGRLLYLAEQEPTVSGKHLVNATTRPGDNPGALDVGFTFDREGALIFSRWTGENIGRRIAIVLDDRVSSAPVVQTKIPGGEGRITGNFTDEEANDLAIVLRAGALPAPVDIIEERTVGPTLGRDSIVLGVRAAIYGFVLVLIFMVIYYRASGVLACIALLLNLVIVLAALAQLRAALTLPGIAGLILTIGMAVDANVLIFERIREELAKAKTVRSAIDSGYDRAFTTILDANVTTLITAFVLWRFGTGPIKGFATVLSIGIVASMFTALLCTRAVFEFVTSRWSLRKLSI